MIKRINILFFSLLMLIAHNIFAQFPYYESFKNSTAPDIVFGGQPTAYLTSGLFDPQTNTTDPVGQGYLRLTRNTQNQKGFIHNRTSFSSQYGLKIQFEYFTYGGGAFGVSADGITFFLYDALVSDQNFKIGGFGGSLGYAQYQTSADANPTPGVTGGYLGIGLDEYGNFSNPTELRVGGPGFLKSSVTLRGKGEGFGTTLPNSTVGNYRYLTHKQTTPDFGISTGSRTAESVNPGYRKVFIDLEPAVAPLTGYFVSVRILTGGAIPITWNLINRFHYVDAAPQLVRYGIASSTGFEHNYHEIRNLSINAFNPVPPVAVNDPDYSTSKNTTLFIPVINNDTDINGIATITKASLQKVTQLTSGATIVPDFVKGGFNYTPARGFEGADSFTYKVKDEDGLESNIATVSITVINRSPVGNEDSGSTLLNVPIPELNVNVNDPSKIDVTIVTNGTTEKGGSLSVNTNGTVKYTPPLNFSGIDSFAYILRDGEGLESNPIKVTITINRPPIARNDSEETDMEIPVTIDIT
ncbi:MAG TPA: Ig-like domain-containing protein, partial [Pedobacter sp.]